MKTKAVMWLLLLAGILWVFVGLRDVFAPGFFSPNGRLVTSSHITLDFAVAAVFIAVGGVMAGRLRHDHGRPPTRQVS
jgi:hypothetical protein